MSWLRVFKQSLQYYLWTNTGWVTHGNCYRFRHDPLLAVIADNAGAALSKLSTYSVHLYSSFVCSGAALTRQASAVPMHSLNDLLESFHLYAECERCQRSVQLSIEKLIQRLGNDFPVTELRAKLRCTSCNIRGQDLRIVFCGTARKAGIPVPALTAPGSIESRSITASAQSPQHRHSPLRGQRLSESY